MPVLIESEFSLYTVFKLKIKYCLHLVWSPVDGEGSVEHHSRIPQTLWQEFCTADINDTLDR